MKKNEVSTGATAGRDRQQRHCLERNRLQRLSNGEIHLWFAFFGETQDPPKPAFAGSILDDEEEARADRLRSPEGRRLLRISHTLIRRALSRYAEVPPQEWRFVKSAHGKPLIDPSLDSPPLSFSLAHTKGLAVVAVTGGADVGVDVEREDRMVDAARLAGRFFSQEEAADLRKLSPERLQERFFLYWTLKESYIKAQGIGLSTPLDSFSFLLAGGAPFRIEFSGNHSEDPVEWRFASLKPMPQYAAAVGVASAQPDPVRIRCYHTLASGEISTLNVDWTGWSAGMEMGGAKG